MDALACHQQYRLNSFGPDSSISTSNKCCDSDDEIQIIDEFQYFVRKPTKRDISIQTDSECFKEVKGAQNNSACNLNDVNLGTKADSCNNVVKYVVSEKKKLRSCKNQEQISDEFDDGNKQHRAAKLRAINQRNDCGRDEDLEILAVLPAPTIVYVPVGADINSGSGCNERIPFQKRRKRRQTRKSRKPKFCSHNKIPSTSSKNNRETRKVDEGNEHAINNSNLLICECGKRFRTKRRLCAHIKYQAKREQHFCNHCSYFSYTLNSLKRHCLRVHEADLGEQQVKSKYRKRNETLDHEWVDNIVNQDDVEEIDYDAENEDLTQYLAKVKARKEKDTHDYCPTDLLSCTCGNQFTSAEAIKAHIRRRQKPETFVCITCGFETFADAPLREHYRLIHKVREYQG